MLGKIDKANEKQYEIDSKFESRNKSLPNVPCISGKNFQMATAIIIAQGRVWRLLYVRHTMPRQHKRLAVRKCCHDDEMIIHYIACIGSVLHVFTHHQRPKIYSRIDFQEMSTYILRKSVPDMCSIRSTRLHSTDSLKKKREDNSGE